MSNQLICPTCGSECTQPNIDSTTRRCPSCHTEWRISGDGMFLGEKLSPAELDARPVDVGHLRLYVQGVLEEWEHKYLALMDEKIERIKRQLTLMQNDTEGKFAHMHTLFERRTH